MQPDSALISYSSSDSKLKSVQAEIEGCHEQVYNLVAQMKKQETELSQMKLEVEITKRELRKLYKG